jgi:hypothetical protein
MVGDLLGAHTDVAYWVEPKYIWRYRNPRAADDVRRPEEATPAVRAYIRSKFAAFTRRRGRARFMEKTPSNCFRVPFIHAVFPDARFLHVVRDGRDVAFSARKKWSSPPAKSALWRRATSFEMPLRDVPFYAEDILRDVIGRQFRPGQAYIWGPHFPGIREARRTHTVLETCALQWASSVQWAQEGLRQVPPQQVLTVRFEEVVGRPEASLRAILDFLDLRAAPEVLAFSRQFVDPEASQRWKEYDPAEIEAILPIVAAPLVQLGYSVTSEVTA